MAERDKSDANRDKKGRFLPGNETAKLGGRPRKECTYSDTLRSLLEAKEIEITYTITDRDGFDQQETVKVKADKNMYYGIAAAQIREAIKGNVAAQKEIVDRIQGKPPQGIDITTAGDKITETPLTKEEEQAISDALKNVERT